MEKTERRATTIRKQHTYWYNSLCAEVMSLRGDAWQIIRTSTFARPSNTLWIMVGRCGSLDPEHTSGDAYTVRCMTETAVPKLCIQRQRSRKTTREPFVEPLTAAHTDSHRWQTRKVT